MAQVMDSYMPQSRLGQAPLIRELASLELDAKRRRVDHPPHGSKDVADAVASVVYIIETEAPKPMRILSLGVEE